MLSEDTGVVGPAKKSGGRLVVSCPSDGEGSGFECAQEGLAVSVVLCGGEVAVACSAGLDRWMRNLSFLVRLPSRFLLERRLMLRLSGLVLGGVVSSVYTSK